MIQTLNRVPSVSGVNENSRFALSLPVGIRSYEKLILAMSGTSFLKANISNIELLANGKPIQQFLTLAHLETISAYYGYDVNANEVVLPFYAEHLDKDVDREIFNMGVSDVSTFQLRGQIGTATAPALDAHAVESIASNNGAPSAAANRLDAFRKVRNYTYALTGAGTTEIDNIPREAFAMAMHLIQNNGNVTGVEAWIDNVRVWDANDSLMESFVNRSGRVRQSNVYHLDWMLKNVLGNQLTLHGSQDFRLKVAHSASDTVNLYVDYLSDFAAG